MDMKKSTLIFLVTLIPALVTVLSITCLSNSRNDDRMISDPGGYFSYDTVMVLLTENASLIEKEWIPADFPEFAFSEIRDIGLIGDQRFLVFYLAEPSRNNVLRAVYQLNTRVEVAITEINAFDNTE
ncbi:MAG: hypothetical protein FWE97_01110 [Dehalococcoidia bacterium]|nr:hypothetical protein [Dehalococcoidia bacterium]